MGFTTPRDPRKLYVGFAHQTAFGTAAATSGRIVYAQVERAAVTVPTTYIDPRGATTGSEFGRTWHASASDSPVIALRLHASSRNALALLQEHVTHGQPTATSAAGDLTEAGDTGNALSTWSLVGVRPGFNSSAGGVYYVTYEGETPAAGQGKVSLYSDSGRTALVAQGSHAYAGTVTLAEQNSSGLSGTVAIASVTASNLTGITLTTARVRAARAAQIARWFTAFLDTGSELETVAGCTVRRMEVSSSGDGAVAVDVEIVGASYSRGAHDAGVAWTYAAGDVERLTHRSLALTYNSAAESCWSLTHGLEHQIWAPLHNAAAPVAIVKLSSDLLPMTFAQRLSDEAATIMTDGLAGTFRAVSAVYSIGSRAWSWSYGFAKRLDPDIPPYDGGAWRRADHELIAREQNTTSPADPLTIYLDL